MRPGDRRGRGVNLDDDELDRAYRSGDSARFWNIILLRREGVTKQEPEPVEAPKRKLTAEQAQGLFGFYCYLRRKKKARLAAEET